jgi:hypothetical protein
MTKKTTGIRKVTQARMPPKARDSIKRSKERKSPAAEKKLKEAAEATRLKLGVTKLGEPRG